MGRNDTERPAAFFRSTGRRGREERNEKHEEKGKERVRKRSVGKHSEEAARRRDGRADQKGMRREVEAKKRRAETACL